MPRLIKLQMDFKGVRDNRKRVPEGAQDRADALMERAKAFSRERCEKYKAMAAR